MRAAGLARDFRSRTRVSVVHLLERELTGPPPAEHGRCPATDFSLPLSDPRLPRRPHSVYVAKLRNIFPRLVQKTLFIVLKDISYILEHL